MTLGNSRSPELTELLRAVMDRAAEELFVGLPGKVESYDPLTQSANIKPLLKRPYVDEDGDVAQDDLGIVNKVPVAFMRTKRFCSTMPIEKGDLGILLFMDNSLDDYMFSDGSRALDVKDLRKHDISDAVFIPGVFPFTLPITTDVASSAVWGAIQGAQVRAREDGIEVTSGGASASTGGFVALANLIAVELGKIALAIAGVGGSYTPGPVASKNLKAD